ncbi:hypothetical protein J2W46_006565 [Paraburkholderia strydomiana]|nr:hypothetical protein [Paraburkholderia strydomiana]
MAAISAAIASTFPASPGPLNCFMERSRRALAPVPIRTDDYFAHRQFVDELARSELICNTMRLTPAYSCIEDILGREILDALSGRISHDQALRTA